MTTETSSTSTMLLDSRDALKKRRRLDFCQVFGLLSTMLALFVGIPISALFNSLSMWPSIIAMVIFGAISIYFLIKFEKEATKAEQDARSGANSAITTLLYKKYSIKLLEPVKFNTLATVAKDSLDYLIVSKEPLNAIDLKTDNRIQVILTPSADRTDLEVALLSVVTGKDS